MKVNNYSVTAIVALYNPNDFFRKTIQSILDQTYPVSQIILVNDGGDESRINDLIPEDNRIEYYSKANGGVASTRNFALTKVKSDFIAFLDQDDFWYKYKLEEQVKLINPNSPEMMICSKIDVVDSTDVIISAKQNKIERLFRIASKSKNIADTLITDNFIFSSTPLIHRSIFANVGNFESNFDPHDDWDLYLRITLAGYPLIFINKSLSVWRFHGENESQNRRKMARTRQHVLVDKLRRFSDNQLSYKIKHSLEISKLSRINELLYLTKQFRQYRKFICSWIIRNKQIPGWKSLKRLFFSFFR